MNRQLKILLLLSLCAGLQASAQKARDAAGASKTWVLSKDQDGIRVYTRTGDSSRFNELKVETTLPGKLSSLATLILDIGNYPNWSFNSEKAYVLKRIGPSELYFYSLIHSPWPASDRDLAVHLHLIQDSDTRTLYIRADEIPGYIPEKKGIVRVPFSIERWVVTPLPGDRLNVDYELQLDPGASAPAWLINLFSTKGPYETFSHLREQLKRPKYHDATLAFIRN
ncbi:MAG TPA: START domain-containing protein [Puia sp.]|nr:START domain-containing protein [Puia sp.]